MSGRAEGTVKQIVDNKCDLKALVYATIGMVVARGTCEIEDIFKLMKFVEENISLENEIAAANAKEVALNNRIAGLEDVVGELQDLIEEHCCEQPVIEKKEKVEEDEDGKKA